ncbi:MAG: DNA polymerase III subunit delta [Opitutales bacterium]
MAAQKAFTLLCGPDEYRVRRAADDRWAELVEGVEDEYAREIVDGQAGNLSEAEEAVARFINAVRTLPMFGDRKAVWFRNISFMGDTRPGGTEGAKALIAKLQDVLGALHPGEVGVLLSASPFSRRSKKVVEWWKTHGDYAFLEAQNDAAAMAGDLQREAAALGVTLEGGAGELLLEKINGNLRLGIEEVRKLATYLGEEGEMIRLAHVAELVPAFGEGDFFETVEAFYSLELEWTLRALRQHFFAGHDGRPVITSLQNRNRLLIQLKVLQDAGALGERLSKPALERAAERYGTAFGGSAAKTNFNLFSQNPWYLGRLGAPLRHLSLKRLMDFQEAFLHAFIGILERPQEQEAVLGEVAVRCLAGR